MVMRNKANLKGLKNKDKKPLYINDFVPTDLNEKRKKLQDTKKRCQEMKDPPQLEIVSDQLYINKELYQCKISPPNPQKMLDYTTSELENIMRLRICKGGDIEQDGNIFQAFTLCTNSLQTIQDAYMKMRLCYPKARHIMCAYLVEGEEYYQTRGYCDDGEHAAGLRILQYLIENGFQARVVFVIRQYSGRKIGQDRFLCIQRAVTQCLETYAYNCRTVTTRTRKGPFFVPYLIIILAGNHMPFARTFSLATPHIRTRHYQKGINTGANSNWHALARFHPAANRCKEHSSRVGRNYFIIY